MKMLPSLAKDSSITENGHFMVRPAGESQYEVVNTVTDEVDSYTDSKSGDTLPRRYHRKTSAETIALMLADAALRNG